MSDADSNSIPRGTWEYVPYGGATLTAEQIADVRLVLDKFGFGRVTPEVVVAIEAWRRLYCTLPGAEPCSVTQGFDGSSPELTPTDEPQAAPGTWPTWSTVPNDTWVRVRLDAPSSWRKANGRVEFRTPLGDVHDTPFSTGEMEELSPFFAAGPWDLIEEVPTGLKVIGNDGNKFIGCPCELGTHHNTNLRAPFFRDCGERK